MRRKCCGKIRSIRPRSAPLWLDVGHVFLDEKGNLKTDLMPDGLHPNEEGYRVWGEAMEPTIKFFLGE